MLCFDRGLIQVSSVSPGQTLSMKFLSTGRRARSLVKYEVKTVFVLNVAVAFVHIPDDTTAASGSGQS